MKTQRILLASLVLAASIATTAIHAGCSSTATHDSTGEYIDDSVITTRVKAALLKDDGTPGSAIQVETFKGEVQLSGFVDTETQRSRAAEIARAVPGVKKVVNNITVK